VPRERGHGDAVCVVRVDDVRRQSANHAQQAPGGRQVHLGSRSDGDEFEAFGGAAAELAVWVRDQRGAVTDGAQAVHGHQHLVLTAAPRPGRVDVKGEHRRTTVYHEGRRTRRTRRSLG